MKQYLISAVLFYLIGSISPAIIVSNLIYKRDVRKSGSGNAGSTNMLRTFGIKSACVVFAFDFLKGFLAVYFGKIICANHLGGYVAALFALIGQMYPIYFKFKGGKGVATSCGVIVGLYPIVGSIIVVVGLALGYITKYISVGSLTGATLFLIYSIFVTTKIELAFSVIISLNIYLSHRQNIKRLVNGNENKIR